MPWVFEYAELQPQDIVKLLGYAPFCSLPATLEKYQVVFKGNSRKWGGALAVIQKKKDNAVYGSAMLVNADMLEVFDKAHQGYVRIPVKVMLVTGDLVEALAYTVQDEAVPVGQPSKEYLKTVSKHLSFYWAGAGKLKIEDLLNPVKVPETKVEEPETEEKAEEPVSSRKKKGK